MGWNWNKKAVMCLAIIGVMVIVVAQGAWMRARMNKSTANITRINPAEFNSLVLRSTKPVVVDFYATWCGPCRELGPIMERVAPGFTNAIQFVKVNYDEAPELARSYNIGGIPTILMFRQGKVVCRLEGVPAEKTLKADLTLLAPGRAMPGQK